MYGITECVVGGLRLGVTARTDEHRNLGVVYHVVADAAEERTPNSVQTARAHHYQLRLLCLRNIDDALTGVLTRLTAHLVLYLIQSHSITTVHTRIDQIRSDQSSLKLCQVRKKPV